MNAVQEESAINELRNKLTAVALKEKPCPVCSVMGFYAEKYVTEEEKDGQLKATTHKCPCADARRFLKHLESRGLFGSYLRNRLPTLQASTLCTLSREKQEKIISKVKADPGNGWAFFGPPGTGKSTLSAALFKHVLGKEWYERPDAYSNQFTPYVFRVTARQLCDEAQAYSTGQYVDGREEKTACGTITVYTPTVTRTRIFTARQRGMTPHLFLEELDKVNLTEFRRDAIFDVINAMHECKGQIVVNSNLSWQEFEQTFGTAFSWRISENCHIVDLYQNQIIPPKRDVYTNPKESS